MEGDNFSGSLNSHIDRTENASVVLQKVFNHCPSGRARRSQKPTRLGLKATSLRRHHNPPCVEDDCGPRFGLRLETAGSFEPHHSEEAEVQLNAHPHLWSVLRQWSVRVPRPSEWISHPVVSRQFASFIPVPFSFSCFLFSTLMFSATTQTYLYTPRSACSILHTKDLPRVEGVAAVSYPT